METDPDLRLRLQFADDGGNAGVDTSPAGQHPALATAITLSDDVAGGRGAHGLFNGTSSNLEIASDFGKCNTMTFTAWINIAAFNGPSQSLFQIGENKETFHVAVENSGKTLRCRFLVNNTINTTSSSTQILGAQWRFVAVSVESGSQRIYSTTGANITVADGTSAVTYSSLDYDLAAGITRIGRWNVAEVHYFSGAMSDVRFYQRVLSISELNSIKNLTTRFNNATTDVANNINQPFVSATNSKITPCFVLQSLSPTLTATVTKTEGSGNFSSTSHPSATWTVSAGPVISVTTSARLLNILLSKLTFVAPADISTSSILTVTINDAAANTTTTFNYIFNPDLPNPTLPTVANRNSNQTFTRNALLALDALSIATDTGARFRVEIRPNNVGSFTGQINPGRLLATNGLPWSFDDSTNTFVGAGSFADINTLVQEITFAPATNFKRVFTMSTSVSDGFNTLTGSKTLTPDNQTPILTGHMTPETYMPGQALILQPLTVSDPDEEDVNLYVRFRIETFGDLAGTFSTTSNLDIQAPIGTNGEWTLFGSITNLNTVLESVVFTPEPGFAQPFTLYVSVSDFVGEMFGYKEFTPQANNIICFAKNTFIKIHARQQWQPVQNLRIGSLLAGSKQKIVCITKQLTDTLVAFEPYALSRNQHIPLLVTPNHLVCTESGKRNEWKLARYMPNGRFIFLEKPVEVFHLRTSKWGIVCANGVMCETAAVTAKDLLDRKHFLLQH